MVAKGDGSWRPCGDYRRLNASTIPHSYAIPNLMTIHHKLSAVFSRLDLVKAFHFVPINEEDIPKTAIALFLALMNTCECPLGCVNQRQLFKDSWMIY